MSATNYGTTLVDESGANRVLYFADEYEQRMVWRAMWFHTGNVPQPWLCYPDEYANVAPSYPGFPVPANFNGPTYESAVGFLAEVRAGNTEWWRF